MKPFQKCIVLLLSFAILGCTTKFLYRNIDWFIMTYIDDYVSLNNQQERLVELSIRQLASWHKVHELPRYIAYIDQLSAKPLADVDAAWVKQQSDKMRSFSRAIGKQAGPSLYALLMQLNEKQVAELLENVAGKHHEYEEKYTTSEESEIREIYQERMEDAFERWVGSITNKQKAQIIGWSQSVEITAQDRIAQNKKMFVEFENLFAKREDSRYFQATYDRLLNDPESFYTQSLKQKMERNRPLTYQFIAELSQELTDKQYQHLLAELQEWREIAVDLVKIDN